LPYYLPSDLLTGGIMLSRRLFLPLAATAVVGGGALLYTRPWEKPASAPATPASADPAPPPKAAASAPASAINPLLLAREGERILGKPDAPITIVEYASFTCPHCATFANKVLPQIKKDWVETGKAKLIYRDFPLDRLAYEASLLSRAVAADRYYAFVEILFSQQEKWVTAKDPRAALGQLAKLAGLGSAEIEAAFNDKAAGDAILAQRLEASEKLSVESTPTLFINGVKVADHGTVDAFAKALAAA
jgi:protein-disulfide isomerase